MVKGYCVKLHKEVTIENPKVERDKRGRKRVVGKCPETGIKVYRYVPEDFHL